ncbi:MAG TPA: metallophosphoesterase [Ktedonobacterales bacterium]|nr:metallophosphoesterase [Ktedonobacterales bacterium]
MNIAIFSDVHGRVLLAFKLCARWEQEAGEKLDLVLQAGDLGAYPSEESLDRATRAHAKSDPSELGFMQDFGSYNAEVAEILAQTTCPMICVRGNHEDHVWLDTLEERASSPIYSIDPYQRVWMLKTGVPYTFHVEHRTEFSAIEETPSSVEQLSDGHRLSIIGVGRIAAPPGAFSNAPDPRGRANRYILPEESVRIRALRARSCNILLTHDSARDGMIAGSGSDDITWLLSEMRPAYHFFGHYGGPCVVRKDANGVTTSCKLADLHWGKGAQQRTLDPGSMGILRWKGADDHSFEVVDAPWLREYTPHSWRYV